MTTKSPTLPVPDSRKRVVALSVLLAALARAGPDMGIGFDGPAKNIEKPAAFRNYDAVTDQALAALRTYQEMYENQTVDYVTRMKTQYATPRLAMDTWEALELMDTIVDESDPDNDAPQIVHAYQTAEALRTVHAPALRKRMAQEAAAAKAGKKIPEGTIPLPREVLTEEFFDALPLVGLIHDLGKVLVLPQFGALPQWSVVGDTFPLGCPLHDGCVHHEKSFHRGNADINPHGGRTVVEETGEEDLTTPEHMDKTGFDNVTMSYGHDEYMATVLERSETLLPPASVYLIRYHSFYAWHTPKEGKTRGYTAMASEHDWAMLPLVQTLQKSDLYSKVKEMPNMEELGKFYRALAKRFLPNKLLF